MKIILLSLVMTVTAFANVTSTKATCGKDANYVASTNSCQGIGDVGCYTKYFLTAYPIPTLYLSSTQTCVVPANCGQSLVLDPVTNTCLDPNNMPQTTAPPTPSTASTPYSEKPIIRGVQNCREPKKGIWNNETQVCDCQVGWKTDIYQDILANPDNYTWCTIQDLDTEPNVPSSGTTFVSFFKDLWATVTGKQRPTMVVLLVLILVPLLLVCTVCCVCCFCKPKCCRGDDDEDEKDQKQNKNKKPVATAVKTTAPSESRQRRRTTTSGKPVPKQLNPKHLTIEGRDPLREPYTLQVADNTTIAEEEEEGQPVFGPNKGNAKDLTSNCSVSDISDEVLEDDSKSTSGLSTARSRRRAMKARLRKARAVEELKVPEVEVGAELNALVEDDEALHALAWEVVKVLFPGGATTQQLADAVDVVSNHLSNGRQQDRADECGHPAPEGDPFADNLAIDQYQPMSLLTQTVHEYNNAYDCQFGMSESFPQQQLREYLATQEERHERRRARQSEAAESRRRAAVRRDNPPYALIAPTPQLQYFLNMDEPQAGQYPHHQRRSTPPLPQFQMPVEYRQPDYRPDLYCQGRAPSQPHYVPNPFSPKRNFSYTPQWTG